MDSQRIVVLPALSRPSTRIRASFSPNSDSSLDIHNPMMQRRQDVPALACSQEELVLERQARLQCCGIPKQAAACRRTPDQTNCSVLDAIHRTELLCRRRNLQTSEIRTCSPHRPRGLNRQLRRVKTNAAENSVR